MIIEIVTKAAHRPPEGISLHKGHGTPDLIPPEALVNVPAAQYNPYHQEKSKKKYCAFFAHYRPFNSEMDLYPSPLKGCHNPHDHCECLPPGRQECQLGQAAGG